MLEVDLVREAAAGATSAHADWNGAAKLPKIDTGAEQEGEAVGAGCARPGRVLLRPGRAGREAAASAAPARPGPARLQLLLSGCPVLRARFTCTPSSRTFGKIRASFRSCFYVQPTSGGRDPASWPL